MTPQQIKTINKYNRKVAQELTELFGFNVSYEYTKKQTAIFIFDNNKFDICIGTKYIEFKKMVKILIYVEMIHFFQLDDKGGMELLDRNFKRYCISKMPLETKYLP